MKWTYALLCLGLLLTSVWGYGQCNDPTVFWRDADGDGFGDRNFLIDDITDAELDYYSSDDTHFTISNNIAFGCPNNAPPGWVMLVSNAQDYDDTNPMITDVLPRTFYFDGDAPHIHLEIFSNGKWKDAIPGSHRIYPK